MTTILNVAELAGMAPIMVSSFVNNAKDCCLEARLCDENGMAKAGHTSYPYDPSALVLTDTPNPFFIKISQNIKNTTSYTGCAVALPFLKHRCQSRL